MGNVLQNCPNGIPLSSINLSNPTSMCLIKYIAVGGIPPNTINNFSTSADGNTWVGRGRGTLVSNAYSIAIGKDNSGNNLWVAVGSGINIGIATSIDAINWNTPGGAGLIRAGRRVKFGRDGWNKFLWVAVGQGTNTIATSSDGTMWTGRGSTIFNFGHGIAYDKINNLWVAVGAGNFAFASSTDGTTWTGRGNLSSLEACNDVSYNDSNLWVAVGNKSFVFGSTATIATSINGTSWTTFYTVFNSYGSGVAYNGSNLWVAVGDNGYATSSNGNIWTLISNTLVNYSSIIYGDNLWIAVYSYSTTDNGKYTTTSTNGTEWNFIDTKIERTRGILYNFLPPVVSVQLNLSPTNIVISSNNTIFLLTNQTITSNRSFNPTYGEPIRKIGIIFKNKTNTTDSLYFDNNYKYSSFNYLTSKYYIYIAFSFTYGSASMSITYQFGNNIIASNVTESIIPINKIITDNFTSANPQFIKNITYSFYLVINNDTPKEIIVDDVNYYLTMNFYL